MYHVNRLAFRAGERQHCIQQYREPVELMASRLGKLRHGGSWNVRAFRARPNHLEVHRNTVEQVLHVM